MRTTVVTESLFDGRPIPAGVHGVVLEARRDGLCLVDLVLAPQTEVSDGDFVPAVLTEDQYEAI